MSASESMSLDVSLGCSRPTCMLHLTSASRLPSALFRITHGKGTWRYWQASPQSTLSTWTKSSGEVLKRPGLKMRSTSLQSRPPTRRTKRTQERRDLRPSQSDASVLECGIRLEFLELETTRTDQPQRIRPKVVESKIRESCQLPLARWIWSSID